MRGLLAAMRLACSLDCVATQWCAFSAFFRARHHPRTPAIVLARCVVPRLGCPAVLLQIMRALAVESCIIPSTARGRMTGPSGRGNCRLLVVRFMYLITCNMKSSL
ncbi:hypothetical protein DFH11DRAFT_1638759, partial [Phellopilus nigrolimitatus]